MERYVASTRIIKRDGEYIVRAYDQFGEHLPQADYFTNDRKDARETSLTMTRKSKQNGN